MTNDQIKKEFNRWIDAGRPKVWSKCHEDWKLLDVTPLWNGQCIYIVDDAYAELRKAFYDGKTIQYYEGSSDSWVNTATPSWTLSVDEYRIKPKKTNI